MAQLLPNVYQRFFDLNGVPLAGGKLYSYKAGTSIKQATYTDQTAITANPNPMILDGAGGGQVWITNAGYKLVLKDANGNVQWTVDQVYLVEPGSITATQIANGAVGTSQIADRSVTTGKIQLAAITTALLANGAVTTGTIANQAITIALLDPNIDLSQLMNAVEVVFRRTDDLSGGRILAIPQYPWSSPSQQSNPGTLPTGQGNSAKLSPDGRFLAVAHNTTPFVTIYERTGNTFTKLTNPGTLPAGNGNSLAWSPNGDFLVICHATTPYITIYQRQGINFSKLSDPGTLPASDGLSASFSPNGEFLAVTDNSGSQFTIYQIKGTTFTSISHGLGSPIGYKGACVWSHDSQYLAATNGTGSGDFLAVAKRTGTTFTACTLSQPAALPTAMAFSPDSAYLVGGFSSSPTFAFQYTISGATLSGPTNPFPSGSPPVGAVIGISVSQNGTLIAIVSATSPYLQIYLGTFAGGWTLQASPANIPTAATSGVSWGPTTQWLICSLSFTPYVQIYKSISTLPATGLIYSRTFFDV